MSRHCGICGDPSHRADKCLRRPNGPVAHKTPAHQNYDGPGRVFLVPTGMSGEELTQLRGRYSRRENFRDMLRNAVLKRWRRRNRLNPFPRS